MSQVLSRAGSDARELDKMSRKQEDDNESQTHGRFHNAGFGTLDQYCL
jgi:hypothetical protein